MSKKNKWFIRLDDILQSIDEIESFTKGYDNADHFYNDRVNYRASERSFQIIGEAIKLIPENVKNQYPDIEWQKIIDMRNLLVHEYMRVDEHLFWNTLNDKLLLLKSNVQQIKAEHVND